MTCLCVSCGSLWYLCRIEVLALFAMMAKRVCLFRPKRKISANAANEVRRCFKDIDYQVSMSGFFAAFQSEVGIELFAAGGAGHKHPAEVFGKTQHLVTLWALFLSMVRHGLVRKSGNENSIKSNIG